MLVTLHLIALLVLVLLGFYVFVANPRSRGNQTFAVFILFFAVWTTKDLVFWNFPDELIGVGTWAAISFVAALLLQYSLVVFAWVFPENSRTPRKLAAMLFAPGIVLIPVAFLGLFWSDIGIADSNFRISLTLVAYIFVGYIYFLFGYGSNVLFAKYRLYRGTQMGQQVGAILWGLIITGTLKTIANIVLPFFGIYQLLPWSSLLVLPGVIIYAFAISNFKLLSLQTALDQLRLFPITYKVALSISTVAISSFVLLQIPITWWAFRNGMDPEAWRKYLVFSVVSALVPNLLLVLLIVRSISRPLQKLTVAAMEATKGKYGTTVDLRKSNDEIGVLSESFNEMSLKMEEDIEKLKQMNEHMLRADRLAAMGTLAAGVAHEINNPLASMSSMIQSIRREVDLDADTAEQLEIVSTQIDRIAGVTKALTDFSRTRPTMKRAVRIEDVLDSALQLAAYDAAFSRLETVSQIPQDLPEIWADPDQLQQVFLNLLLNARDAMPDGGSISINVRLERNKIVIEIEDSGTGMDANILSKAFTPFYTTKPAGTGTGLGLAVCYGIITSHDGDIELTSEENDGTKATIILPVANT